jgi:hypothetical protein
MSDGPDPLLVKVFEQLDSGQTPAQIARALRRDGHAVDDVRHAFRGCGRAPAGEGAFHAPRSRRARPPTCEAALTLIMGLLTPR